MVNFMGTCNFSNYCGSGSIDFICFSSHKQNSTNSEENLTRSNKISYLVNCNKVKMAGFEKAQKVNLIYKFKLLIFKGFL